MITVTPDMTAKLAGRLARARSAIGHGILYQMGAGGMDPSAPLPSDNGHCDCSGFALAWVQGISRLQEDKDKPWSQSIPWINTDAVYNDAKYGGLIFVHLSERIPGCAMVYPSSGGVAGHCCIVESWDGQVLVGIDCHGGVSGHTVAALELHNLTYFIEKGIPVALKEDLGLG